jgi:hypothetical protein
LGPSGQTEETSFWVNKTAPSDPGKVGRYAIKLRLDESTGDFTRLDLTEIVSYADLFANEPDMSSTFTTGADIVGSRISIAKGISEKGTPFWRYDKYTQRTQTEASGVTGMREDGYSWASSEIQFPGGGTIAKISDRELDDVFGKAADIVTAAIQRKPIIESMI